MREKEESLIKKHFLSVVFKIPLNSQYTYFFEGRRPSLYSRVVCDFAGRMRVGMVVAYVEDQVDFDFELKEITSVLDDTSLIGKNEFSLGEWISQYYFCSLGESLSLFVPFSRVLPSKNNKSKKHVKDISFATVQKAFNLNKDQDFIKEAIINSNNLFHLIHGVTGSGKTHIYLSLINYYLSLNKQVLLLLPEIALTPQTRNFFESYLPKEKIEIVHSKVTNIQKLNIYKKFYRGDISILIGTRSLVFAPAKDLGMIIIDEEHESTYKNNSTPRYHARQIAQIRSLRQRSKLIMGSATPSVDLYYLSLLNNIVLHKLSRRYTQVPLPKSKLIFNVTNQKNEECLFDDEVIDHLTQLKSKRKQAIIYLNKRGYSNYIRCYDCGFLYKCSRCEVTYTYHKSKNQLICHYCNSRRYFEDACFGCNSKNIGYMGMGTERIYEELKNILPNIRFARVDSDVTNTPKKIKEIFLDFKMRKIDILIGTQILSKGHDFPNLNSVVILNPESILAIPDFRSSERTFNQITQVSGRAGRRGTQGEVYIQTMQNPHYSILYGCHQDYLGFYQKEIERRKEFDYPPFVKLFRMVIRSKHEKIVTKKAIEIGALITSFGELGGEMLSPAPCVLSKVNQNYRWNIIFKIKDYKIFKNKLQKIRRSIKTSSLYYVEYDMDPYDMF